MIVVLTLTAVAVLVVSALVVLELQDRRRRRVLGHLGRPDRAVGDRAVADMDAARSTAEGISRAAHAGTSGAAGMSSVA
ncbi:hypothetical protein [Curtobacterium sp. MCPF17_046]|uniref:hypothetical protein n=1 Tax=Curtobacterium sp. MCPF17_046 TaxID=2175663 RepID=UPI000D93247C|nr:hypothetical protein [Curtobacterium sp. MCPF17_046]PYY43355.1 hypothetical protein DEJ32_01400 [Curtobacterium sp. MCPF17_046]